MSVCVVDNQQILRNIRDMEELDVKSSREKVSNNGTVCSSNEVCSATAKPKSVKVTDLMNPTTPVSAATASSLLLLPLSNQVSRSIGRTLDKTTDCRFNGKNCLEALTKSHVKLESRSGSGDQDGLHFYTYEDGGDQGAKKRKTRRGKPKHRKLKPYSKQHLSYQQQQRCRSLARSYARLAKTGRQPPAPYNTTQFLMDDHSDLPDLEQKLSEAAATEGPVTFQKPPVPPPRTRDSSFSVDSDEDYFYSFPEDEEEFLTKEFSSAYEDLHAERLGSLSKSELIQEYIQLEAKVDLLTKRLRVKCFHQFEDRDADGKCCVQSPNTTDLEVTKKLKIYQQRIDELIQQNEQLRRENETLKTVGSIGTAIECTTGSCGCTGGCSTGNSGGCNDTGGGSACGTNVSSSACTVSSDNGATHGGSCSQRLQQCPDSPVSSIDSESDSDSTSNENNSICSYRSPTSSSPEHFAYNSRTNEMQTKNRSVSSLDSKSSRRSRSSGSNSSSSSSSASSGGSSSSGCACGASTDTS